jgi:hypothetical protein
MCTRDPVVGGARLEGVAEPEGEVALGPLGREGPLVELVDGVAEEVVGREGQQIGLGATGLLPPGVEVPARHDVGRDPLVVEALEVVEPHDQVVPAEPGLELLELGEQVPVVGHEAVATVPLALDQGVAHEQLPGVLGVDEAVAHEAFGDERQAVERDSLVSHGRSPPGRPVRLAVAALDQVAGELLGPLRPDAGDGAGPEPRGLDQLGRHHPVGLLPGERRTGEDGEARLPGTQVLTGLAALLADVRQEPRQQGPVHEVGISRLGVLGHPEVGHHPSQLGVDVGPLPHPQEVEVLPPAEPPEGARRQLALLLAHVGPEVDEGEEVGRVVVEARVELVSRGGVVDGTLARVLDRERGRDDQHLAETCVPLGLEHHAGEAGIDRQAGHATPDLGQVELPAASGGLEGAELVQEADAVGDRSPIGRVDEREGGDVAEADRRHLQDDRRQVGAEDLGIGVLGTGFEVLLGVEADADAVGDPTAPTGPLVRRCLGDRLDRQALHLQARAVAGDASGADVDHVADAGNGERGLGHVGGQHDAPPSVGGEHAVLLGERQPGVERDDLGVGEVERPQRVGGVADVALAGQEHERVAGRLAPQLADSVGDGRDLVPRLAVVGRRVG